VTKFSRNGDEVYRNVT